MDVTIECPSGTINSKHTIVQTAVLPSPTGKMTRSKVLHYQKDYKVSRHIPNQGHFQLELQELETNNFINHGIIFNSKTIS